MDNLLLLSMLIVTVAVPAITARLPHPRRGLAWTLIVLLGFTLAYVLLLTRYYADNFVPEPFQP